MSRRPRRPSFRSDDALQAEIRRINKLVQNKQSRLRTQKGLETLGVNTQLYKEFNSRREIETYQRRMEKFLTPASNFKVATTQGVEVQYKDIRESEKIVRKVNRQKEKEWGKISHLPFKHRGYDTGWTVADQADPKFGMKDPRYSFFREIEFDPNRYSEQRGLERRMKDIKKAYGRDEWIKSYQQMYKDNYLKSLENVLGDQAKQLRSHIFNMELSDFAKEYFTENNADIGFVYDHLPAQAKIAELERVWGVQGQE